MDAVLAALTRQIETTNPEARLHHEQARNHRDRLEKFSLRYLSTLMPSEQNVEDWIALPLFQQGKDIPIDNDGRSAILIAHAPLLEQILKSWHEIRANAQQSEENQSQRKAQKREPANEETEHGNAKRLFLQNESCKCPEDGSQNDVNRNTNESRSSVGNESIADRGTTYSHNTETVETKEPSEFYYEYYSMYDMSMSNVGAVEECVLEEVDNSPSCESEKVLVHGTHNEECGVSDGQDEKYPDQSYSFAVEQGLVNNDRSNAVTRNSHLGNSAVGKSDTFRKSYMSEIYNSSLSEYDPGDATQMERQLASIGADKEEHDAESSAAINNDLLHESYRAAYDLEREINGEALDSTNYTKTTLRAKPSCVVVRSARAQTTDLRPASSKTERKNSTYSKIKQNLLKRIAESGILDVDATNAAAKRDDYKNTICYQCQIDFTSSKRLYVHNLRIHSEGQLNCDVCFKLLKNRITLMKHKKIHLSDEDMQCICNDCGKKFKDKRSISAHIAHTRRRKSVCQKRELD